MSTTPSRPRLSPEAAARAGKGIARDLLDGTVPPPPASGRYERLGRIGEGAMAVVYEAVDRQLDRKVALKIPKERASIDASARRWFRQEAQAAARVSHPHIVAVHDVGEEEGRPFLVMELVDGLPLSAVLKSRALTRDALLAMIEKIARALHRVHAEGIIHRDLKPGNILVTREGEPKISDFGLSHWVGSGARGGGSPVGTPMYMAPEQVDPGRGDVTIRTDVHALGTILYEAAAGRPAFPGDSATEIYVRILQDEAPPPRRIDPSIPPDLETIILKAMRKDPDGRYATALEFADDLARLREGRPILARAQGPFYRVRKAIGRNRAAIAIAFLAAAALAAGVIAWRASLRRVDEVEALRLLELARPALEKADQYLYRADADYEGLVRQVNLAQPSIEKAVALAPDVALGHYLLGRAWSIKGWDDRAEACWRRAIALDPKFGPPRISLGRLLVTKAHMTEFRPDRETIAREATELMEAATPSTEGGLARELARAMLALARRDSAQVRSIAVSALERYGNVEGSEDLVWMQGLASEGPARGAAFDDAIRRKPHFALAHASRGLFRYQAGDLAGATADYDAALRIQPRFVSAYVNRGAARGRQGQCDAGIADCDRALEIEPGNVMAHVNKASCLRKKGDLPGAIRSMDEVVRLAPRWPMGLYVRGTMRGETGDLEGARADLQQALDVSPSIWVERPHVAEVLQDVKRRMAAREH